jgi:3-methyladenine DNA glycosylase/8-oxoguanine DNA glycosylase
MANNPKALFSDETWKGATVFELPLVGGGGEPVDLWRTLISHGLASLPPMSVDEDRRTMLVTLPLDGARPRLVHIAAGRTGQARVQVAGRRLGQRSRQSIESTVRWMLRLDDDYSGFYDLVRGDPDLAWVASGAGRMVRSPTVFEEVIRTICTTNCAWSATQRMIGALCQYLGEPAAGAPADSPLGRAFPTPGAMAEAGEAFYRDVARAGYRGAYMSEIARQVAQGELDLEWLTTADSRAVPDEAVAEHLLELPGVGPYAAAHIMLILGRHSRLILDSWTRPKYAQLSGKKKVSDRTIERRFRKYGPHRGLAFWMYLTRDWSED